MFNFVWILLVLVATTTTALEPYQNFQEGSCITVPPVEYKREWVHSLEYIVAGSRLHLYWLLSALPNYSSIREDQFYYDSCLTRNSTNLSTASPVVGFFGLGRLLGTAETRERPGIYMEGVLRNSLEDVLNVALTDNKSFALLVFCRPTMNQKSWVLVTNTPNLDPKARKRIEEHAASLGFRREYFVFLRFDSCHWGNPLLEHG